MMNLQIIITQIFGITAILVWVVSVQASKKDNILKFQIIANVFYAIYYALLTLFSATCMNIVSVIRMILTNKFEKENKPISKWFVIIFSIIIIIIGIVTYSNYLSLIPILITLAYTFATSQKNMKLLRIIFLICAIGWVFFNSVCGAYIPLVGNIFEIISGIISIVRYDIKTRKGNE